MHTDATTRSKHDLRRDQAVSAGQRLVDQAPAPRAGTPAGGVGSIPDLSQTLRREPTVADLAGYLQTSPATVAEAVGSRTRSGRGRRADSDRRARRRARSDARRGLAEQRQFLLDHATARYVLFLDDDVWLEPGALARMHAAIEELGCGVVGRAVRGLSHLDDEHRGNSNRSSRGMEP